MPVRNVNFASLLASSSKLCLSYILPDNAMPPIYRIPQEVLSEIFKYVLFSPGLRTVPNSTHSPVVSSNNCTTPFLLSHVSKYFHDVVTKNPSLWTSIAFLYPLPKRLYLTSLWLVYSRRSPLDIVLFEEDKDGECNAMVQLFDLLLQHVERWRDLKLSLTGGIPLRVAKVILSRPTLLRDVDIDTQFDRNAAANIAYKGLLHSPSLRNLTWKSPVHSPSIRYGAHITSLDLDLPILIGQLINNLAYCPNLVSLSVAKVRYPTRDPTPINPLKRTVCLPRLRVLILILVSSNYEPNRNSRRTLVPLLSVLSAPCLTQISLKGVADHPDEAYMDEEGDGDRNRVYTRFVVQDLIRRSSCKLYSLNADIPGASSTEVLAWMNFEGIEALRVLCISGGEVDDKVLEALTWDHAAPDGVSLVGKRFPHLMHLGLAVCALDIDDDVLLRMLGSRFWTPVDPTRPSRNTDGDGAEDTGFEELRTAHIWVRELTPNMKVYEDMMEKCSKRIKEWVALDRFLEFKIV
ncbi:hypothetical protein BDN70DRAFT_990561 [Pholiota conissans]|uniref:F-box domain-containing protein n=1 Tax=Pholiota conissans TaxID=109636 RepID=A0A9P5Z9T5_9AGAR|nr:hypothetical protein BDN70DRAFT_990561 [Pholiota conissans]